MISRVDRARARVGGRGVSMLFGRATSQGTRTASSQPRRSSAVSGAELVNEMDRP